MEIIEKHQEFKMWEGSTKNKYYIQDIEISARKSNGGYQVTELENALKTGAMVESYRIFAQGQGHEDLAVLDYLRMIEVDHDIKSVYEYLKDQDYFLLRQQEQ